MPRMSKDTHTVLLNISSFKKIIARSLRSGKRTVGYTLLQIVLYYCCIDTEDGPIQYKTARRGGIDGSHRWVQE